MELRTLKAIGFACAVTLFFSFLSAGRACGYALEHRKTYCSIADTAHWLAQGASREFWLTVAMWALVSLALLARMLREED